MIFPENRCTLFRIMLPLFAHDLPANVRPAFVAREYRRTLCAGAALRVRIVP